MKRVSEFEPRLATILPETYALLASANLVIHDRVSGIVLHGSRGLSGGYRPDSDIDLSLIVETKPLSPIANLQALLQNVFETTSNHWQSSVEIDLAIVFDSTGCGLKCFDQITWGKQTCRMGGVDCFGLYKIQKGFHGFVSNASVRVNCMVPCLKIWKKEVNEL